MMNCNLEPLIVAFAPKLLSLATLVQQQTKIPVFVIGLTQLLEGSKDNATLKGSE